MAKIPVIDPTKNVLDLVGLSIKRIDDLRDADQKLTDTKFEYEEKLRLSEAKNNEANFALQRALIQSTQDNATLQLDRLTNRVSAIELSQSQSVGKTGVINPIIYWIGIFIITLVGAYIALKR